MTGYQKAICILLAIGFLLSLAGNFAFVEQMPILGLILGGSGFLFVLSALLILRKNEQKEKEEVSRYK